MRLACSRLCQISTGAAANVGQQGDGPQAGKQHGTQAKRATTMLGLLNGLAIQTGGGQGCLSHRLNLPQARRSNTSLSISTMENEGTASRSTSGHISQATASPPTMNKTMGNRPGNAQQDLLLRPGGDLAAWQGHQCPNDQHPQEVQLGFVRSKRKRSSAGRQQKQGEEPDLGLRRLLASWGTGMA